MTSLLVFFVLLVLYFLYGRTAGNFREAVGETAQQRRERRRVSAEMIPSQRIR